MDKKTLLLMLGLGLVIAFLFFFSRNSGVNINQFVQFGEYMETSSPSASGKTTFSDLNETPTPSPSPFPTLPPL